MGKRRESGNPSRKRGWIRRGGIKRDQTVLIVSKEGGGDTETYQKEGNREQGGK